jgi:hypothetical protein
VETVKILVAAAALLISVASFVISRMADTRSRKAEDIRNLLGYKESVAFGALKLLRDGLPKKQRDRTLLIAALMQACVFEGSDRARALLYRTIDLHTEYRDEFKSALRVVEETFKSMDRHQFTKKELDLYNGKLRIGAVKKVLGEQSSP